MSPVRSRSARLPPAPCLTLAPSSAQVCVWRERGRHCHEGALFQWLHVEGYFLHSSGAHQPFQCVFRCCHGDGKARVLGRVLWSGRSGMGGGVWAAW